MQIIEDDLDFDGVKVMVGFCVAQRKCPVFRYNLMIIF